MNKASSAGRVLIVEDDAKTSGLISELLGQEGYQVQTASSLFMAQGRLRQRQPDLVILDRRLPDGDGCDFCRQLKADPSTKAIPVLFLTSKSSTTDKVVGLKIGGDDYLAKPFDLEELLARVEALLRRASREPDDVAKVLENGGVQLDLGRHLCTAGGKKVALWPMEFELLQAFLERPGRLLSKEFLSERVWGHELLTNSRAIETSIQRLRRKLGPRGRNIETVKGFGFRWQDEGK
jgi:DNA-binding response OmpR family regulator